MKVTRECGSVCLQPRLGLGSRKHTRNLHIFTHLQANEGSNTQCIHVQTHWHFRSHMRGSKHLNSPRDFICTYVHSHIQASKHSDTWLHISQSSTSSRTSFTVTNTNRYKHLTIKTQTMCPYRYTSTRSHTSILAWTSFPNTRISPSKHALRHTNIQTQKGLAHVMIIKAIHASTLACKWKPRWAQARERPVHSHGDEYSKVIK